MKRLIVLGALLVAVMLAASSAFAAVLLDKVIAIVNKEVITWSDLYKTMEFEAPPAIKALPDQQRREYFKKNEAKYLEMLIEMKLQLQQAPRAKVSVSEEEVNRAVESIRQKMNLSKEAFEATIKKEGFSMADYRQKLKEQILLSRVVDVEVRNKIVVTDADIKEYLAAHPDFTMENEGYHLAHIFIVPNKEQKEIEEKLKLIYGALNSGIPFADVARKYSEDTTASNGGDLGFIKKDQISKEFLDVLVNMRDGDVSPPFGTENGIHIVKLIETRLFKNPGELRELVRQKIVEERFATAYKNWRRGLRDQAYIDIMLE
jgi:peptidyl-prolyl cis-trans isomerase SurA